VRHYPRDRAIRAVVPSGIELAPPRREVSTGPGRHDFEIVVDPTGTVEEDLARRDFTINAMARRLEDGSLVDPFGGVEDLDRRQLRTVGPTSFDDDPLRIVRGLRFVSQLDFDLAPETLAQMEAAAPGLAHVSAERIGGGIRADGQGELSKLLLGRKPARALVLARDTGVLTRVIPEFAPAIGFSLDSDRQPLVLDEHLFAVAQLAADNGYRLEVRLAALLHDLGKPHEEGDDDHPRIGAALTDEILERLRYPTRVRHHVVWIVAHHGFKLDRPPDARDARRFLAEHGDMLAHDLVDHKIADLAAKDVPAEELERVQDLRQLLTQERAQPHHLSDLAVTGDDLRAIGFAEGPSLGGVLRDLLSDVVDDPACNTREWLLERAAQELA
jgi:tRNA nucleotidyltransferase/poly(A) polymerase